MVDLKIQLPDGFLEEEVRCGYTITSEMKEVWAVELDLLAQLLNVCNKHKIKIFACGGTLLGAVRHKGFIPWDDDIDMMMFREDYNRLCEIAQTEFQSPYFFQTEYSDPGSLRGHAQLRNSNTTGILKSESQFKYKFNQGIFIDIFPLDNVIKDEKVFAKQCQKALMKRGNTYRFAGCSTRYSLKLSKGIKGKIRSLAYYLGNPLFKMLSQIEYKRFEQDCAKFNTMYTELVSTLSLDFSNKQYYKMRRDFEEIVYLPFEFIEIPVGKEYEHALKQRYGDYMEMVKGGSLHGEVLFNTSVGYKTYLEEN